MNDEEREQRIGMLVLVTGWSIDIFNKMTEEELQKIYVERVVNR